MLKMTIFQKLLIGIIAMLMLIATISFISIVSINELENTSKFMLEESREQNIFQRLKLSVQQLVMPPNDYLIHGNKVEIRHFKQLLSIVQTQIDECREIIGHPLEQKGVDEFENSLIAVESLAVEIFKLENPIGNSEGAIKMEEMDAITNEAIINLDKLLTLASLEISEYINANQKTSIRATKINIFIGLFIAICLVVGGFFYVKEITKPIKNLSQTAQKISLGDLSAKANVNIGVHDEIDDFAKSFNNMIGILAKTTVSRDYFNNILNRMVDTLIITDTTGKITLVNQATIDLLEYTEEEIIGQSIEKILFRNGGNEVLNNIDIPTKLNEESVQNVYNTYYSKSNKAIPVSFSRSFMYDSNNKKMGISKQ